MTKSEQWKRGAIIIAWVDDAWPHTHIAQRNQLAAQALQCACPAMPWDYNWREVVESIRDRSAQRRDKRAKS